MKKWKRLAKVTLLFGLACGQYKNMNMILSETIALLFFCFGIRVMNNIDVVR